MLAAIVLVVLVLILVELVPLWYELPPLDSLDGEQTCVRIRAEGFRCSQVKVKIENVPATLKQAIIAAEDPHFYEHHGFWGGQSTITSQVARNFHRVERGQLRRHLSAALFVFKIEFNFSKNQILESYINTIFLGNGAYGFEAAAQTYFGKSLTDITLAEAAMLAGLPKAPSLSNPIINPPSAKARQEVILNRMLKAGVITDAQCQQALAEVVHIKEPIPLPQAEEEST